MIKLKTSTKTILAGTLVFLCIFFFISSAYAIDIPAKSYNLKKGDVVTGSKFENTFSYTDDKTFDIRFKKTGWWPIFFFQLDITFELKYEGKYDQIKVYFTKTFGAPKIGIHVYYTDGTKDSFWENGGDHTFNVDVSKYLDYIRIKAEDWHEYTKYWYIYIDYIAGVSFF